MPAGSMIQGKRKKGNGKRETQLEKCLYNDVSITVRRVHPTRGITRSSADADNGLDAFVGQSRSTNISGPFQVK